MIRSLSIQIFLSCSFKQEDKNIVDLFAGLCKGLDLNCVNVDKGYVQTPPDKARELIGNSSALVAIATCRDEIKPGVFSMPKAVIEEITMAFAIKKPILIFAEKGVDMTSGFEGNYASYFPFDRESLFLPEFLEKVIASIHGMKMDIISPQDFQFEQLGQRHVFAEFTKNLIELVEQSGSFTWRYSQTRRLRFTSRFIDPITAAAWAEEQPIDEQACDIKWSYRVENGNRPFKLVPTVDKCTQSHCFLSFRPDPIPGADDFLEYTVTFESPYFNPIFLEDIRDPRTQVNINGGNYLCFDGHVPIVRTKDMKIQWRFPSTFGLTLQDFAPFVGSYTNKVDFLVESEMKRIALNKEDFGGNVFFEMSVQSPLLQHVYAMAWNPPSKKTRSVRDSH